ncbi:hypothetical protein FUMI01_24840 [Flavobacterium sp. UMI-01]|nr:hypothetical protein FUMI01_24840 [Flavobacterium sp. UMI-01]
MTKLKGLLAIALFFLNWCGYAFANETATTPPSQTGKANETLRYSFTITNHKNTTETYFLSVLNPRDLACETSLTSSKVTLEPNQSFEGQLSVVMNKRIPLGGHESSFVSVKDEKGNEVQKLEFVSVREMPHPFLLVTPSVLQEAEQKVKQYSWAKNNRDKLIKELANFKFPEHKVVTKPRPVKVWSSLNYSPSDGENAFKLALAYKLTGDKTYLKKLMTFIKLVSNKEKGYLSVGAATYGVQVHEGNFFLFLAAACDIIYDEPDFTTTDRENIVATFRHYLKQNRQSMEPLGIMNHQASANAGAILVALYLQDMPELHYLTYADGGMADQIGKGVMGDGWWFESTANYCYLVVQRYALVAQAFKNYGLDLYHTRFPVKFKSVDFENCKEGFTGMKFDNWGDPGKNTRGIEDMVTPYIAMMDEEANVVSSNDSNIKEPEDFYELAYREYKREDLAWVIGKTKRESWVSLLYGVPELPQVKDPRTESAYLPNVGLVALRSQSEAKGAANQIQAYAKYGTHGGWHGHFDRASLIALDRNGHKYFGTEMVWFGYGNPGYKECVQTSATHNMVVVDELQQEALPSEQLLFYKGKQLQASIVETNARWRNIPRWNADKFPPWEDTDYAPDFKPVQQRRLTVVTDDYVVIADYMKSDKKHNYDWLLHPVGFQSLEGVKKQGPILEQLSTNENSPYHYFKKAQWYQAAKGASAQFDDNGNKLDIHSLWPKKATVFLCNYPVGGKQHLIKNNPERKTYGMRVTESEVVFLHLIEPYQGNSTIEKIESKNPEEITVYLKNGKKQQIQIKGFKGNSPEILLNTFENNKIIHTEIAK